MQVLLPQSSLELEITLVLLRKTLPLNHWYQPLFASLSQYSYTSDGTEKCPDVTVTYGDKTLAAGTDFTVSYKDNVKEGTATVTITGAGNYTGIINTTFTITAAPGKDDSDAGKDNPGKDDSSKDDSGKDDSGKDDSGKDDSGKDDSGKDNSGKDDSGKDNSGKDNSGKDDSDKGNQNSSMKKAENPYRKRLCYTRNLKGTGFKEKILCTDPHLQSCKQAKNIIPNGVPKNP